LSVSELYFILKQSQTLTEPTHEARVGVSKLIKRIPEFWKSKSKFFGRYKSISIVVGIKGVTLLKISEFFNQILRVSQFQE
jgi:hypothetical protein